MFLSQLCLDSSLSSSKTSDRYTEGRAGYVVKSNAVAELNGRGISAVLTADTNVEVLVNRTSKGNCHVHKLTNTGGIELSEGIVLEDLGVVVSVQELAGVVTGEAEGHLSQVVRTEAEEVSVLSDLVSGQDRKSVV